jgi:hypothetical protein
MTGTKIDPEFGTASDLNRHVVMDDYGDDIDLRTGPELADMRMDDHQRRIAQLEQRVRHVETLLHQVVNLASQAADSL